METITLVEAQEDFERVMKLAAACRDDQDNSGWQVIVAVANAVTDIGSAHTIFFEPAKKAFHELEVRKFGE
jgi:hypothetical protein